MNYSPGLDGLRAIAVLAVVLNHLEITGFAGGYVGVDVFFVLSGFLITSIIRRRLQDGSFRLVDFYLRRVVRLLPALVTTVLGTTLLAAALLTPWDFQSYARSAIAALFSVSNILFYAESGYWDTDSALKPLLHTWSLGVEEQFYLFWPLLLIAMQPLRSRVRTLSAFAALCLAGTLATLLTTHIDASAAFYLMPLRVFQFAAGAMLSLPAPERAVSRSSRLSAVAAPAGLALLLLSLALLDGDQVRYPGAWALMPTAAAALLILASTRLRSAQLYWVTRLMESRAAVFLGVISYALYLVHWPLVSLASYRWGALPGFAAIPLFALMLLLATALHYGVERRFYHRAGEKPLLGAGRGNPGPIPSRRRSARLTGLAIALMSMVLLSAWLGDGWAWRRSGLQLDADSITAGMQRRFQYLPQACQLQIPDSVLCAAEPERRVLVLGNSLEPDGFNFLRTATGSPTGLQFLLFGNTNRCPGVRLQEGRIITDSAECQRRFDRLFAPAMLQSLDGVFYAANRPYDANKDSLLTILRTLRDKRPDLPVITLGGYINTRRRCSYYIVEEGGPQACTKAENVVYFGADPASRPLYRGFKDIETLFIDRVELLCDTRELDSCRYAAPGGAPLMYDAVHSSLEFAEYTGSLFRDRYGDLIMTLIAANEGDRRRP